jgi:hypothetical protein
MNKNSSINAAAGEYFVLAELLRKKQEAYLAHGSVQPNWDIVCIKNQKLQRVQVKTIDWPTRKAVTINQNSEYDYIVVVLLNREYEVEYFVFSKEDFDKYLSNPNLDRKDKNRTVNFGLDAKLKFEKYYKRWWFN